MEHTLTLVYCSGNTLWPIQLPVVFRDFNCRYTPKSDFFLSFHKIPRVVAEVVSTGSDNDEARMLLQCGCIVRLVNGRAADAGQKRNFILMAFYMNNAISVTRYLVFQNCEPGDDRVCCG